MPSRQEVIDLLKAALAEGGDSAILSMYEGRTEPIHDPEEIVCTKCGEVFIGDTLSVTATIKPQCPPCKEAEQAHNRRYYEKHPRRRH